MDVTENRSLFNGLLGNTLISAFIVHMFFMFSPRSYIGAVIIEQKNERVDETLILGKLIRWVGKWFLLVIVA